MDVTIWLYPSLVRRVDGWLEEANCSSRSEFVAKALRFYIGYLCTEDVTEYLNDALLSSIRGSMEDSLNRLGRMVFKWSVTLNMVCRTVAEIFRGEYMDLDEMSERAEDEVRMTNGQIQFTRLLDADGEEDAWRV